MEQKELKIDITAVARQVLQVRQPGEDLDEVILRACKHLYGESGAMAFQAARGAIQSHADRNKEDFEDALRDIAEGRGGMRSVAGIITTQRATAGSLDELLPEMRAEVERALASGKSERVVVSRTVRGPTGSSFTLKSQPKTAHCEKCGYEVPSDFDSCPQCGTSRKRSFWSRLFGG